MPHELTLISHALCPYVQRAAIVLTEKGAAFARKDIDLNDKPAWFRAVSPLGKTPVLLVDGTPIFESAVICEYLDDTIAPRLHPEDALARARHRAWIEFGSSLLNGIAAFYNAPDAASLRAKTRDLRDRFEQLEQQLPEQGAFFSGTGFSLVDATFGPIFRYFDVFDAIRDFGFFTDLKKTTAWREQLRARPSIQLAVAPRYSELLREFLIRRQSALSSCIQTAREDGSAWA